MAIRIEEAFNDCFERLSFGESLDSCLHSYPEYAADLNMMLRTVYDVKRRAYPIQPRPEFKYWSRVKLQGVQDYMSRHAVPQRSGSFNFRRNLAISMAGLLVLIIASSGTAAASNDALPDQPLYGVKMAVEQAQVSLATSDIDRAEIYAKLAEKRAREIEAMARQGKAEYLVGTSAKMDYQLEQAETYINRFQVANAMPTETTSEAGAAATTDENASGQPTQAAPQPPMQSKPYTETDTDQPSWVKPIPSNMPVKPTDDRMGDGKTGDVRTAVKQPAPAARAIANMSKAKTALNSSTAKSLATLQDALDKAPESARPAIIQAIERMKKANEWSQKNYDQSPGNQPQMIQPRPKYEPPTTNKPANSGDNTDKNNGAGNPFYKYPDPNTSVNPFINKDPNTNINPYINKDPNTNINPTIKRDAGTTSNTGINTGTSTDTIKPTTILTDTQKLIPSTQVAPISTDIDPAQRTTK